MLSLVARQGAVERRISSRKTQIHCLSACSPGARAQDFLSDAWPDKSARYRIAGSARPVYVLKEEFINVYVPLRLEP
jgi:hypothetical protein